MKSNGYFMTLWIYIWQKVIKNSVLYRFLTALYSSISCLWRNSGIISLFRKKVFFEKTATKSLLGKILFSPFDLLEGIRKKNNERITAQKEKSVIIRGCKYFLHNILAINLRFIGVFILAAATVDLCFSIGSHNRVLADVIVMVLGAVLVPVNYNVADALKNSWVSKIAEKCLGTELTYTFYYVTKCGKGARLFCAMLFGGLTGLVCGLTSPVYALAFAAGLWMIFMILYKTEFGVFITLFLSAMLSGESLAWLCLICLVSFVVKVLMSKKFEWRLNGVGLLILGLLVVYLFSSAMSLAPTNSLQVWVQYFIFTMFYFVIINTIRTKKQFFDLLTVVALSFACVCAYQIIQYVVSLNVGFNDIGKIFSFGNTGIMGEYVLFTLPICVGLMLIKSRSISRIFYGFISLITVLALILIGSKGCWTAIAVSMAIFITFVAGKLWGLLLVILPIMALTMPQSFFTQMYSFYSQNAALLPHSQSFFLQIPVESGAVGVGIFLLIVFIFIKRLVYGYQAEGKGGKMSIALTAVGASVTGFLINGLLDNSADSHGILMLLWAIIAVGLCGVYIAEEEKKA